MSGTLGMNGLDSVVLALSSAGRGTWLLSTISHRVSISNIYIAQYSYSVCYILRPVPHLSRPDVLLAGAFHIMMIPFPDK